jgi:hypothetical protein
VSPVKYELGFYIPEDGILHSHRREYLKLYIYALLKLNITMVTISMRLVLSKGTNRVGIFLPSPEDGNLSSLRRLSFLFTYILCP